jgi:hypothetical protein
MAKVITINQEVKKAQITFNYERNARKQAERLVNKYPERLKLKAK